MTRTPDETRPTDDDAGIPRVAASARLAPVEPERYELDGEIGLGGLGRLMRARDLRLGRIVALKLLRRISADLEARFRREAEITARLQHPGIVPIHEVGRWPTGEPFYVMKLVSGQSLKQVLADATSLRERLPLVPRLLAVCEAVGFAHSRGVVHRDLKPSNLMLGEFGETLVIDWGIAKELGSPEVAGPEAAAPVDDPLATAAGAVIGTPAYMPPEQARGEPVDRRADVYALGAILYHVLAGRPPFEGDSATRVLEAVVDAPPASLRGEIEGAPAELLAIADKAMARDPSARYADAGELATDLKRFVDGQLVQAHQYTAWQRLGRFVQRNRRSVAVALVSLVALVLAGSYAFLRVVQERGLAERALAGAQLERSRLYLSQAKQWLDHDPTIAVAWLKAYAASAHSDPDEIGAVAVEAESRGAARQLVEGRRHATLAPDGHTLAAIADGHLIVWQTDHAAARTLGSVAEDTSEVKFAADGKTVFTAEAGTIRAWSLADGSVRELHRGAEPIVRLLAHRGGLVAAGERGTIWRFDPTGAERSVAGGPVIANFTASGDGQIVLAVGKDRSLTLWRTIAPAGEALPIRCKRALLSANGNDIACIGIDGAPSVYDLSKHSARSLVGHPGPVQNLAISPDGKRVAGTGTDKAVHVWTLGTQAARVLVGHANWTMFVQFSADGRLLATTSLDRTVRIWDLETGIAEVLRGHKSPIESMQFAPDARSFVTNDQEGNVRVWPLRAAPRSLRAHPEDTLQLRFVPGGRLFSADGEGKVSTWDPATGVLDSFHEPGRGGAIDLSPDGRSFANTGPDGIVWVRAVDGVTPTVLAGHEGTVHEVRFSPDGKLVATAGADHTVRLWDAATGAGRIIGRHDDDAWHLAFSPDQRLLVSAGDDLNLRLWDLQTGAVRALVGHRGYVYALAFSPDGKTIASAGLDRSVRLWSVADGTSRVLGRHSGLVQAVSFSPDGRYLASGSDDESVHLWDLQHGSERILAQRAGTTRLSFSADGRSLVTTTVDGSVRIWDVARAAQRAMVSAPGEISALAIARDTAWLAVSTEAGEIFAWNGLFETPLPPSTAAELEALGTVVLVGEEASSR